MKKYNSIFRILILSLLVLNYSFVFSQIAEKGNAYQMEADGYFSGLMVSASGIVATDNYASTIYLIHNGVKEELFSSAGCGRYYNLSPDKNKIGFKIIQENGLQVPAILEISSRKITQLHQPVNLCGQVSFSNTGKIAFTVGNILHVVNGASEQTYDLGVYSNISALSPDGNFVVYNNDADRLFVMNLSTMQTRPLTDNLTGYMYPVWSPDGNKVLYSSISGKLFVADLINGTEYFIGEGIYSIWSSNSENIIFTKISTENYKFLGSDIYMSKYDGTSVLNLTNTPDINEMGAVFSGSKIIYHTLEKRQIAETSLHSANGLGSASILYTNQGSLHIKTYNISLATSAETRVPGTVPYVNQVYDTPTWHYGYGSCAPTTAIMAIAYYNKLPKWPTTVAHGSVGAHNSDYGSYVADKYRFNEYYYQDVATANSANAWGGYGYMWNTTYSPHSHMRQYMESHYMTSVQEDADNWAKAQAQITAGHPFPVCNLLTTAGHLTLGIGFVVGQHTMIFNDPYGNKNNATWPNTAGANSYYDWPGYNNGFQNLNTVAWTVTAETTEIAYNDTIIDDVFYNHGFYINNSQNSSKMAYFHDQNAGYNNHFWFTGSVNTSSDVCYVTWTPNISQAGNYEVSAYIPGGTNCTAQNARYQLYDNNGRHLVVLNQGSYTGQWVSLGTYAFSQGQAGYVYLGDSTGVASQNLAWDAMRFRKISSTDIIAPTTSISTTGNWKTADFTASFTDQDNTGGSGIEKSYYQVLDFNGQQWGANADRGFFADNFDVLNSQIWTVPAASGTWTSLNGNLYQSDSTVTNTNIYASLKQNLSNRYLYHFTQRMESAPQGTNQRRVGFHFFSDSGSLGNRGNSYFIFFRQETSKLEFYKVVSDVFTLVKVIDNVTTNIGQWYDVKVIYDRITGKVTVYRDDVFLGTWTDPTPLTTSGKYISFRTGNCKMSFGEIKVFRSRAATALVTVGSAASDIRYQNPVPTTYGAKIKSIVADSSGNLSPIAYYDLNVDWSVPSAITVNDGISADTDTTSSLNKLSANWQSSTDANSGIAQYFYCIGTTPGGTDIFVWTSSGLNTSVTKTGLSLIVGTIYYISVKSVNAAGLESVVSTSDGITVITNGYSISGKLTYNNTTNAPLSNATMNLYNASILVSTTTTDIAGNYTFSAVSNGTYTITCSTAIPWGGVTATDALKMKRHIAGLEILAEPIRLTAADVNLTSSINSTDVLKVQRRLAGLDLAFARADWIFEKPLTGGNVITVNNSNLSQNMYALCTGDVNGSYVFSLAKNNIETIQLINEGQIAFDPEKEFAIPVRLVNNTTIGAFQLYLNYSTDDMEIMDVAMENNSDELIYNIENGQLSIIWSSLVPLNLQGNDILVRIKARAKNFNENKSYDFQIQQNCEFANEVGLVLENVSLKVPKITTLASANAVAMTNALNFDIYPNPISDIAILKYNMPNKGRVKISIVNVLGEEQAVLLNEVQNSGNAEYVFDAKKSGLSNGVYFVNFYFEEKLIKVLKVIKN